MLYRGLDPTKHILRHLPLSLVWSSEKVKAEFDRTSTTMRGIYVVYGVSQHLARVEGCRASGTNALEDFIR